jgi:hypothetical protein
MFHWLLQNIFKNEEQLLNFVQDKNRLVLFYLSKGIDFLWYKAFSSILILQNIWPNMQLYPLCFIIDYYSIYMKLVSDKLFLF